MTEVTFKLGSFSVELLNIFSPIPCIMTVFESFELKSQVHFCCTFFPLDEIPQPSSSFSSGLDNLLWEICLVPHHMIL